MTLTQTTILTACLFLSADSAFPSEPVRIEGGDVLGGLVRAAKPTPAERYGAAAEQMTRFYLAMDAAVLHREGDRSVDYHPNQRREFSLDEIERGRDLLGRAAAKAATNPRLLRRVDQARFAHSQLTLVRVGSEPDDSLRRNSLAREARSDTDAMRAK